MAEAREQTRVADALYDWTLADAHPLVATTTPASPGKDLDRTPTGSTKPAWPLLLDATDLAADGKPDDRVVLGQEELDSLEGLDGSAFDAEYKDRQRDALAQVDADYRDYLVKGDDVTLLALAKRELPDIIRRRGALKKI